LALWANIYDVCGYNCSHDNNVKGFWRYGLIFMMCVVITVAMTTMLRDFGRYRLTFNILFYCFRVFSFLTVS
jgi:hypothetical protein